jgi:hypothetical protein
LNGSNACPGGKQCTQREQAHNNDDAQTHAHKRRDYTAY